MAGDRGRELPHEEIRELLAVVALDASSREEREVVEAHLLSCGQCRREFAELREAAALLGTSAGGEAPPGLWSKVLEKIRSGAPEEGLAAVLSFRRPAGTAGRPRSLLLRGLAAAASLLLLLALATTGFLAARVDSLDSQVAMLSKPAPAQALQKAALYALSDPRAIKVPLQAPRGNAVLAEMVIEPNGIAFLINRGLPALNPSQTYQLWGVSGANAVSLGVIGPNPSVVPLELNPSSPFTTLALTREPRGGVVVSHNPAVALGSM